MVCYRFKVGSGRRDESGRVSLVKMLNMFGGNLMRKSDIYCLLRIVGMVSLAVLVLAVASPAFGRKVKTFHTVKPGESVARIADFYGVSQRDLLELNGLGKGRPLKVGQELKIPNVLRVAGKKYTVKEGDSFASLGEKFKQTPKTIAAANKMSVTTPLPIGKTLVIPDASNAAKTFEFDEGAPKSILFLRIKTGERERLNLYSKSGNLVHKSVQRLSYLARDIKGEQKTKRLHFRLIHMLQEVASKYPGKPIEIISGYRAQSTGNESQHAFGRAMDFRMPGVPAKTLFRMCKSLPRAGCGYYPNSGFVHMDARSKRASWIDYESKGKK